MKQPKPLRVWTCSHGRDNHVVAAPTKKRAMELAGCGRRRFEDYWHEEEVNRFSFVTVEGYWSASLWKDGHFYEIKDSDYILESTRRIAVRCDLREVLKLVSPEHRTIQVCKEMGLMRKLDRIASLAKTAPEELQDALYDLCLYEGTAATSKGIEK
jgi:hypothetical protein